MDEKVIVVGYYNWEDDACRIIKPSADSDEMQAQIYSGGVGFTPVNLQELLHQGIAISEAEFKALVLEEMRLAKRADGSADM